MKTRLATIAALSLAAVIGTAAAAQAGPPKGPGGFEQAPTTTTTAKPKGPDKVAPTPTTQPPKGPGDIAQPQPGDDPKPPQGPGDIAQPQPDPVVDPKPADPMPEPGDKIAPKPNTGGDSNDSNDSGNSGESGNGAVDTEVQGETLENDTDGQSEESSDDSSSTEASAKADQDGGVSPFLMLAIAAAVAGLIALGFASRRRNDEQDAEQL